jgi:hypothetical protein
MHYVVKPKSILDDKATHKAELIKVAEDARFVRFTFVLLDVASQPIASGICPNESLEPGTRLHKWLSVFNGEELAEGTSVDPEEFVGLIVEVKIKNATSNGIEYVNIVDLVGLIPDSTY